MRTPIKIRKLVSRNKVPVPMKDLLNDTVEIEVDIFDDSGDLRYPYVYQIAADDASRYPTESRHGVIVYIIPLGKFNKIAKRAQMEIPDLGECIASEDPKLEPWKGYL